MPKSFVDPLKKLSQLGTVVHLGAGSGLDLPELLATQARRIVLIEPGPAAVAMLRKAATDARCTIMALAIAPDEGQAKLRQFNFPALSSLKAPLPALSDLFPGMAQTVTTPVDTLPLATVMTRAGVDPSEKNALIIDAPGMEGQIVDMALALPASERFAHIILRAGALALYEGASSFDALSKALADSGYRSESNLSTDPDFPAVWFRLDPLFIKFKQLETTLEESVAARKQAEDNARQHQQKIDALEARLTKQTEERETMRASSVADKQTLKAQTDMVEVLQSQNARLQDDLARAAAHRKKLEAEFLRVEAQLQLMREFMDLSARREGSAPVAASLPDPVTAPTPTPTPTPGAEAAPARMQAKKPVRRSKAKSP